MAVAPRRVTAARDVRPTLHDAHRHLGWDRSIPPAITIEPGTEVVLDVPDAGGGQLTPGSTADDVAALDPDRANPLLGPIAVEGVGPGDTLTVEILEFAPAGWGWTAIIPGFGLLADEFTDPFLQISRFDGERIAFSPGITLPTRPFPGTIGVAPGRPGRHPVIPPRRVGGNLDFRDLVRGSTLYLPVECPNALLSIGDTHAAQGDGEVCGTAVEAPMEIRVRVGVRKDVAIPTPQMHVPPTRDRSPGARYVTTGIGDNLYDAGRDAVRAMIDHLMGAYGLSSALAYCLCSVAVNLHIAELVDAPNWVVAAYLPLDIFS